jgi:hypothetical protein
MQHFPGLRLLHGFLTTVHSARCDGYEVPVPVMLLMADGIGEGLLVGPVIISHVGTTQNASCTVHHTLHSTTTNTLYKTREVRTVFYCVQ